MEQTRKLYDILQQFIQTENINVEISKSTDTEIWFDNSNKTIIMKIIIDHTQHQILYDIYDTDEVEHLTEKTIKDVERNEHLAEDNRKWKKAEAIEDMWLLLDEVEIWAKKHGYRMRETNLL
jgi:predicted RNase H-related nuclease YkuK (DUF458 family)